MADVLPLLGDKATALTHSETSLRLYTARAARPGATADDRMQVCLGEMKLGDLLGNPQSANLGRPADALRHFELGVACMRALVAAAPNDLRMRRNLAATLQRIGGMHEAAGRWSEAERVYTEVFGIVQTLAAAAAESSAPLPPQLQRDVAVGYGTLARVQRATGRKTEAVANYREVLARFERMVRDDPSNAAAAHGVAVNQELLGGTLAEAGQVAAGVRLVEQAVAANRRLIAADATKVEARCDLAHALEALGDARRHQPGPRPDAGCVSRLGGKRVDSEGRACGARRCLRRSGAGRTADDEVARLRLTAHPSERPRSADRGVAPARGREESWCRLTTLNPIDVVCQHHAGSGCPTRSSGGGG